MSPVERAQALDAADDLARGLEPAFPVGIFQMGCAALDTSQIQRTSYGLPCPERPMPAKASSALRDARLGGVFDRIDGTPVLPNLQLGSHDWESALVTAARAAWRYERELLRAAGLLARSETDRFCRRTGPNDAKRRAQIECIALGLAHWHGAHRIRRTGPGHLAVSSKEPRYELFNGALRGREARAAHV